MKVGFSKLFFPIYLDRYILLNGRLGGMEEGGGWDDWEESVVVDGEIEAQLEIVNLAV